MATTFNAAPLVFVREHAHGPCYAFPLAYPRFVARGESEDEALEEQRFFLSQYLARCPAGMIADTLYPDDAELLDVAVVLPRPDLRQRLRIVDPVTVPCLVIPDGRARWIHIVPFGETLYVKPTEDPEARVRDEIRRAAAAAALTAQEYLGVLPTTRHRIVRLPVEFEREDVADAGQRAARRRQKAGESKDKAARKLLASVGTELLSDAKISRRAPPVLGRDREIETLASLLLGPERLSVMLVGEPMTGKTAVVHGLLSQTVTRFSSHPVFATSGAQLVAGQSGFGQLQQRIDEVMAAAERIDAVLYFDDYADLFAGHSGSIEDIAAMMRPWLADNRVRVVGELSPDNAEHHERRHVAFFAAMHRITVEPADAETTRRILSARIAHQRKAEPHRPQIDAACIDPLVELADRYLPYQAYPGKCVLLAEELRAVHESEIGEDGKPRPIRVHDVYRSFSIRSGIPTFLLREEQAMRYTEVLETFARSVIGQRAAVEAVAQALCTVKAGLQPPNKPLANLLFVGPTGVGKTEVAKCLARFLFGGTDKLVRFDMSEYADPYAPERLIRGSERNEGELTRKVRQQPFCVVLLDEIEKAHPAVFDLLLQVLGEGRLSDANGKTTYFHNCIVIMTSNLGAAHRKPASGFGRADEEAADLHKHYLEQVDRHFRPEFVNRLDRVIPFASLSAVEISAVARVALRGLATRDGLRGRGVTLAVSDRALAEVAAAGYSDQYGARALRRHLEDHLVAPVATVLAAAGDEVSGGAVAVVVDRDEDESAVDLAEPGAKIASARSAVLGATGFRGPPRADRRGTHELRRIATLRRTAATCLGLEAVEELRDRLQYLVAELARGARAKANTSAAAAAEHAELERSLRALDDALLELEGAEDLATAALAESEPLAAYTAEAERAMDHFERTFTRAVLRPVGGDEAQLIVRAHANPDRLASWLAGLLRACEHEGWRALVHRWQDKERVDDWPRRLPWGPPRERDWVLDNIDKATPKELAQQWRGAVVRLRGPLVGPAMCFEAGLHRFVAGGDRPQDEHVLIALPKLQYAVTAETLDSEPYELGKAEPADVLARRPAVRTYDVDRGKIHAGDEQSFDVAPAEFWATRERLVFSVLADRLMRGEGALPGGEGWS